MQTPVKVAEIRLAVLVFQLRIPSTGTHPKWPWSLITSPSAGMWPASSAPKTGAFGERAFGERVGNVTRLRVSASVPGASPSFTKT